MLQLVAIVLFISWLRISHRINELPRGIEQSAGVGGCVVPDEGAGGEVEAELEFVGGVGGVVGVDREHAVDAVGEFVLLAGIVGIEGPTGEGVVACGHEYDPFVGVAGGNAVLRLVVSDLEDLNAATRSVVISENGGECRRQIWCAWSGTADAKRGGENCEAEVYAHAGSC